MAHPKEQSQSYPCSRSGLEGRCSIQLRYGRHQDNTLAAQLKVPDNCGVSLGSENLHSPPLPPSFASFFSAMESGSYSSFILCYWVTGLLGLLASRSPRNNNTKGTSMTRNGKIARLKLLEDKAAGAVRQPNPDGEISPETMKRIQEALKLF
jgi:hypothetical protein